MGQATLEWLLLSAILASVVWLLQSQWSLLDFLRDIGEQVIDYYNYVLNYVPLAIGTGL